MRKWGEQRFCAVCGVSGLKGTKGVLKQRGIRLQLLSKNAWTLIYWCNGRTIMNFQLC